MVKREPTASPQSWDWQGWLDHLDRAGIVLGVERMQRLLTRLGHPQRGIPVIHVAGTNGKGSVCAALAEILCQAGMKVGRYTSPHLVSWQERIWVNGQVIPESDWARLLGQIQDCLTPGCERYPTQFDVTTAAAWLYFREQQVEMVVLEVGLGGRLDSTNALPETKVAVITSIGMDHWERLGSTLPAIAAEKAGIIKPGIPTVTAPQEPGVMEVLSQVAQNQGSPLWVAPPAQVVSQDPHRVIWEEKVYTLHLLGPVQRINMGVVLRTVGVLRQLGWSIPEAAVKQGLATTTWAGRLQRLVWQGREIWLDGAHNVPGAEGLRQFVDHRFAQDPVQWLIGILANKDAQGILAALLRPGDRVAATGIPGHHCYAPQTLLALAHKVQPQIRAAETVDANDLSLWLTGGQDPVILCGSLYLLGSVMGSGVGSPWAGTEGEVL